MLRMLRIHPLIDETRMVAAGSRLCWTALAMKSPSHPGTTPGSYPPEDGKKLSVPASSVMAMSPSQKYGTDDRNVVTGSTPSAHEPRRQPASTPSEVPSRKLATVVTPTRVTVHGRLCPMTVETGVGKNVNDSPRSPCNSWFQYCTYCSTMLRCLSSPKRTFSDSMELVLSCRGK